MQVDEQSVAILDQCVAGVAEPRFAAASLASQLVGAATAHASMGSQQRQ
jgi:hypothetical protein